jgi:hypothetical protein
LGTREHKKLLFIILKKNSPASKNAGSNYRRRARPGTFRWSEDPSTAWYLPPQEILLAETRFLQTGKGVENTKEDSRCFTYFKESKKRKAESSVKAKNMD